MGWSVSAQRPYKAKHQNATFSIYTSNTTNKHQSRQTRLKYKAALRCLGGPALTVGLSGKGTYAGRGGLLGAFGTTSIERNGLSGLGVDATAVAETCVGVGSSMSLIPFSMSRNSNASMSTEGRGARTVRRFIMLAMTEFR